MAHETTSRLEQGVLSERKDVKEVEVQALLEQGKGVEDHVATSLIEHDAQNKKIAHLIKSERLQGGDAKFEIDVNEDTETLHTAATKAKLNTQSVLRRFKQLVKPLALAASLFTVGSFTEGCATIGAEGHETSFSEKKEHRAPPFAEVKRKALEDFDARIADYAEEVGVENVKDLRAILEGYDEDAIKKVVHEKFGVPKKALEREGTKEIKLLTGKDVKKLKSEHPSWAIDDDTVFAMNLGDRLLLKAKNTVKPDHTIDVQAALGTMTHEGMHSMSSDSERPQPDGDQGRFWDRGEASLPTEFTEGVTELMNMEVRKALGTPNKDQSYAGGNFMSAYLSEQLIGREVLAKGYFEGDGKIIKVAFEKKLGRGSFDEIFKNEFGVNMLGGSEPRGMLMVLKLLQKAKEKGINLDELREQAKTDGIQETFRAVIDTQSKVEGVFFMKEIDGVPRVYNGVIEGEQLKIDEFKAKLRVFIDINTGSVVDAPIELYAKTAQDGLKIVHDAKKQHVEFVEKEKLSPSDTAIAHQMLQDEVDKTGWRFNLKVNILSDLQPLFAAYKEAKSPEEKQKIFSEVTKRAEKTARETIQKVKEKISQ